MLARLRASMREKDEGFTLIELLVVMIIIGILAAIAVPVFLSQRQKARDSSTKADVTSVGKEIATYYVDNSGTITGTVTTGTKVALTDGTWNQDVKLSPGTAQDGTNASVAYLATTATGCASAPLSARWIVRLTNTEGATKTWYYSAQGGLSSTAPTACS